MSAIVGVRATDAIHLLTNAATTALRDGVLVAIHPKQIATRTGVAIAGVGLWPPCTRFARLIDERGLAFDDVIPAAKTLWAEASETLSQSELRIPFVTLFAGWSKQRERLEIHGLRSAPVGDTVERDPSVVEAMDDLTVYAGGPSIEAQARAAVDQLAMRWFGNPDAFNPCVDGVAFMERMRREFPREYETAKRPAVGGYVRHTTVTPTVIHTAVIHRWPDRVGHVIDAGSAGVPVLTLSDMRKFVGAVMAQEA